MMAPSVDQVQPLTDAVLAGQRTAVGKALSLVEGDSDAALRLCRDLRNHTGQATLIGLTGPPGCGKSSLINTIIAQLREQRCTVAVAAVDPSSRISGGAILGDRLRMAQHARDEGVFIRSLSSQGHLGGLTLQIHRSIDVLDAAGFDWIIVETVGTGQNEQEVAEITDAQIVVCTGEQGDDIQALKAGVLEIADVLVVNKADLIPAGLKVQQLETMLALRQSGNRDVAVIATSAITGEGVQTMLAAAKTCANNNLPERSRRRKTRLRTLLAQCAADMVTKKVLNDKSGRVSSLCRQLAHSERSISECATELLGDINTKN